MKAYFESYLPTPPPEELFQIDVLLFDEDDDSTRTKFYFNGEFKGYGVEDEHRDIKVKGETRVDNGLYEGGFRYSPKFSRHYYRDDEGEIIKARKRTTEALKKRFHTEHELFWVKDTPRHEFILWHWGNKDDNTDGCYCVGSSLHLFNDGQRGVGASRAKYEEIYPLLWRSGFLHKKSIRVNYNR